MAKNKSWIVTLNCKVKKSVVCNHCTEEEARKDTFRYAVEETEMYPDLDDIGMGLLKEG